jgi:ubiquinone/menaquinone biosynthesis C-methylase UbiE
MEKRRILGFDTAESAWTPELTALHEEAAGFDHPIDCASRRLAVRSLRRFVTAPAPTILDVGCSSGYILREVRQALPHAAVIGSDFILPPLLQLAERMADVPLLQFDLRRCPLPRDCVDAVTALNVLEHIDEDELALGEIYRILKPGGVAHIEVPAGPNLFDIYDEQLMHHRRYRLSDLIAMGRRRGFQIIERTHLGFFLYPAFWLVKKRHRKLLTLPKEKKKRIVTSQIRRSQRSPLLSVATRLECFLGRKIPYPFGIRCVVVLGKPIT